MNSYILIVIMAITTIAIRFAPFILFSKKTPPFILYLGSVLPYCTMAMLVVFCFRDTDTSSLYNCMPELLAGIYAILLKSLSINKRCLMNIDAEYKACGQSHVPFCLGNTVSMYN